MFYGPLKAIISKAVAGATVTCNIYIKAHSQQFFPSVLCKGSAMRWTVLLICYQTLQCLKVKQACLLTQFLHQSLLSCMLGDAPSMPIRYCNLQCRLLQRIHSSWVFKKKTGGKILYHLRLNALVPTLCIYLVSLRFLYMLVPRSIIPSKQINCFPTSLCEGKCSKREGSS